MKCKRCGADEDRIHGFCSIRCEETWEWEQVVEDIAIFIETDGRGRCITDASAKDLADEIRRKFGGV